MCALTSQESGRYLPGQLDLLVCSGGLSQGKNHLHRGHPPAPGVQIRFAAHAGAQLVNFVQPRTCPRRKRLVVPPIVVVDVEACCRLTDFAKLARRNHKAGIRWRPFAVTTAKNAARSPSETQPLTSRDFVCLAHA